MAVGLLGEITDAVIATFVTDRFGSRAAGQYWRKSAKNRSY
jgi:hypothetical protein